MCKTVAQAFHWFDRDRFKAKCQRILKLDGSVVLLWNSTDNNSPINIEIANINRRLCEKFDGYSSRNDYPVRVWIVNSLLDKLNVDRFILHRSQVI